MEIDSRGGTIAGAGILFASALIVFYITAAPGMGTEDSAELAGGARLLTIVHAPGYPLYLLAGHLAERFAHFPGRGLVLLSVFSGAAAVGLFGFLMRSHFGSLAAAAGAVSLLFCYSFWRISTEAEVYACQVAAIVLSLDAILRARANPDGRALRWMAFCLGLTLAHHVGFLIHLPACLLFLGWELRGRPIGAHVRRACGYFALGLALYGTLMLHSHRGDIPLISWNPIRTPLELFHHATGAGFKKWLFAVPIDRAAANMVSFPLRILLWFPLVSVLLIVAGAVNLWKRDRPLVLFLGAIVGVTVLHTANYAVIDPENFLIPAIVPAATLAAAGFRTICGSASVRELRSVLFSLLLLSALGGKLYAGGFMAGAFRTWPVDAAREILQSHDRRNSGSDTSIVWADWAFYPTLRYMQIIEGRGATVDLEMDSTSETPGSKYLPGRTWTMRPSIELGAIHPLAMSDLHWKVGGIDDRPETSATAEDAAAVLTFGGIDVLDAWETPRPPESRIVRVAFTFRVSPNTTSDTIGGEFVVFRDNIPILSTPFRIHRWKFGLKDLEPGRVYSEQVEIVLPSAHFPDPAAADYRARLEFETSDASATLDLPKRATAFPQAV